jgi:hypothetical protein
LTSDTERNRESLNPLAVDLRTAKCDIVEVEIIFDPKVKTVYSCWCFRSDCTVQYPIDCFLLKCGSRSFTCSGGMVCPVESLNSVLLIEIVFHATIIIIIIIIIRCYDRCFVQRFLKFEIRFHDSLDFIQKN